MSLKNTFFRLPYLIITFCFVSYLTQAKENIATFSYQISKKGYYRDTLKANITTDGTKIWNNFQPCKGADLSVLDAKYAGYYNPNSSTYMSPSSKYDKCYYPYVSVENDDKTNNGIFWVASTQTWKTSKERLLGNCAGDYIVDASTDRIVHVDFNPSMLGKYYVMLFEGAHYDGDYFLLTASQQITRTYRSAVVLNKKGYNLFFPSGNVPPSSILFQEKVFHGKYTKLQLGDNHVQTNITYQSIFVAKGYNAYFYMQNYSSEGMQLFFDGIDYVPFKDWTPVEWVTFFKEIAFTVMSVADKLDNIKAFQTATKFMGKSSVNSYIPMSPYTLLRFDKKYQSTMLSATKTALKGEKYAGTWGSILQKFRKGTSTVQKIVKTSLVSNNKASGLGALEHSVKYFLYM